MLSLSNVLFDLRNNLTITLDHIYPLSLSETQIQNFVSKISEQIFSKVWLFIPMITRKSCIHDGVLNVNYMWFNLFRKETE